MGDYLDKNGTRHLLDRVKGMTNDNYLVIIDLLSRILSEDKIQRLLKLNGTQLISGHSSSIITLECGYEAYEIKTLEAENTTQNTNIQVEILEDDVSQKVLFKSHPSVHVYDNTGGVCNIIDEQDCKAVYLRVTNFSEDPVEVAYEVKLVNLLKG